MNAAGLLAFRVALNNEGRHERDFVFGGEAGRAAIAAQVDADVGPLVSETSQQPWQPRIE